MKKLAILTALMLSLGIILTGCASNTDSVEDVDSVSEDVQKVVDRDEYQFKFTIRGDDGSRISSKVYKKWENSMIEFIDTVVEEDMPFVPKKSLIVDGVVYSEVEKDGETFRFSMPGMDEEIFNLEEMSTIDMSMVVDTKKEKINGKKMTCYYMDDALEGKGKSCLYKWVFAYGEFVEDGVVNTIEITDYDDSVKSSVFEIPADANILGFQDMMELFQ